MQNIILKNKNITLYHDDCLEVMPKLSNNYVDMIFCDPPYMLSNNGVTCHAGKMVSVNKGKWDISKGFVHDVSFHKAWISECKRILKPEGTIWISGTHHSIYQCGFLLQELGFHILNDIIWYKPNAAPNLACTTFAHSHETLLWAKKDKKYKHTFNYLDMKNGDFSYDKMKNQNKQMRSVWSIATPTTSEKIFGKHPTQKPVKLLERVILSSTKENDIVLDPFNGSGTTAVACQLVRNRNYIGIEKNEEYIKLTTQRIEAM